MDELVNGILKTDGKADPLKILKISLAIAAPILAIVLSFIRSIHANTHAQHVGQQRLGRGPGLFASLLIVAAVVGVGWTVGTILTDGPITSPKLAKSEVFGLTIIDACWLPVAAAGVALLGVLIGGLTVHKAESNERRPSGLARLAGGLGTLTLGLSAGLLLYMLVTLNPSTAKPVEVEPSETLSGASTLVLSLMIALLVVGLGWCFYRAIKAGGKNGEPQVAEQ